MALKTYTYNDDTKPVQFNFNKKEFIFEKMFYHISGGVFKSSTPLFIDKENFQQELNKYSHDILAICKQTEDNKLELVYALNVRWCNINVVFDYCEDVLYYLINETDEKQNIDYTEKTEHGYSHIKFNEKWQSLRSNECEQDFFCETKKDKESKIETLKPNNLDKRPLGEKSYININGSIGILVEPGIYYFGTDMRYSRCRHECGCQINVNSKFDVPCGMLCYSVDFHPTMMVGVQYFGVGTNALERLKEINENIESLWYYEFCINEQKEETKEDVGTTRTSAEIAEYVKKQIDDIKEVKRQRSADLDKELISGNIEKIVECNEDIGIDEITVTFKTLLSENKKPVLYDYAYIKNNELHLEKIQNDDELSIKTETYPLSVMTKLTISKKIKLKCGLDYTLVIPVLDCEQEVIKKVINEEYQTYFLAKE